MTSNITKMLAVKTDAELTREVSNYQVALRMTPETSTRLIAAIKKMMGATNDELQNRRITCTMQN